MKPLLPILFLASTARASVLTMDLNGYPVDVALSAPLPAQWAYAENGGLIQTADATQIIGGAYFPDGTGDYGWTILPSIPAVNVSPTPWAFEVLVANPAEWRIDIVGDADDSWNVLGEVTSGFGTVERLTNDTTEPLGDMEFPTEAAGAFCITENIAEESDGFPIFAPEPSSLAVFAAGISYVFNKRIFA